MESCNATKSECNQKLEERKTEFTAMKKEMQAITDQEAQLKTKLEEANAQKRKYQEHCDLMK